MNGKLKKILFEGLLFACFVLLSVFFAVMIRAEDSELESGSIDETKYSETDSDWETPKPEETEEFDGDSEETSGDASEKESEEASEKESEENSEKETEEDNIPPVLSVTYSKPSNVLTLEKEKKYYYNGDIEVTITVHEENFDPELVVVSIYKLCEDYKKPEDLKSQTPDKSDDETFGYAEVFSPDISWNGSRGSFRLSEDGEYFFTADCKDTEGNAAVQYNSLCSQGIIEIDTKAPVIRVEYQNTNPVNTLTDKSGNIRDYFTSAQTATVTVSEKNFSPEDTKISIIAEDVSGEKMSIFSLEGPFEWEEKEDGVFELTIVFSEDSNYTFDISAADLAKNESSDYPSDYFTIDTSPPENLTISYSESIFDTVLSGISFGFYNAPVTVTISAEDNISGVNSFSYSYLLSDASGTSKVALAGYTAGVSEISYSKDGKSASISFTVPSDMISSDSQFNGGVEFSASDISLNDSNSYAGDKRIIVDSISPEVSILLPFPVNTEEKDAENNFSYYNECITAAITVTESNFYSEDVRIVIEENSEKEYLADVSWSAENGGTHTGIFELTEDGSYIITVSYTDKSGNQAAGYKSPILVLDTEIAPPEFTVNGKSAVDFAGAYAKDAQVGFSFDDVNFSEYDITLTRQNLAYLEDITESYIYVDKNEDGGSGSFSIPVKESLDGIYCLDISVSDKASNTASAMLIFTLNRYGSVYVYDDYLVSIISDGGKYLKLEAESDSAVEQDLIITEYNASSLLSGSAQAIIMRDGEVLEPELTTSLKKASYSALETADVSSGNGWYSLRYTIDKSNFEEDGTYTITLTSAYKTVDSGIGISASAPGNSMDPNGRKVIDNICFTVDTTPPEFRNIIIPEYAADVPAEISYTAVDAGGLKTLEIYIGENLTESVDDFTKPSDDGDSSLPDDTADVQSGINKFADTGASRYIYSSSFEVEEKNKSKAIRLVAEDLAGNTAEIELSSLKALESDGSEDFDNVFQSEEASKVSSGLLIIAAVMASIVIAAAVIIVLCVRLRNLRRL